MLREIADELVRRLGCLQWRWVWDGKVRPRYVLMFAPAFISLDDL